MTAPIRFVVVHRIPGRIRLQAAALRRNPSAAARVVRCARNITGVTDARSRAETGTVLLKYDVRKIDEHELLDRFFDQTDGRLSSPLLVVRKDASPKPAHVALRGAFALGYLLWGMRRLTTGKRPIASSGTLIWVVFVFYSLTRLWNDVRDGQ